MPHKIIIDSKREIDKKVADYIFVDRFRKFVKPFYTENDDIKIKRLTIFAVLFIFFVVVGGIIVNNLSDQKAVAELNNQTTTDIVKASPMLGRIYQGVIVIVFAYVLLIFYVYSRHGEIKRDLTSMEKHVKEIEEHLPKK